MTDQNLYRNPFEEAKELHHRGVNGDKQAVIIANKMLSKLREAEPDQALIEAYYGSTLVLLGWNAVKIMDKADLAQEGLDALNGAVALDPNHKEIRFLRGNVCLRLPESFFRCSDTAIEDFVYLLERNEENTGYLTEEQVSDVLRNLSAAYLNAGEPDKANEILRRLERSGTE